MPAAERLRETRQLDVAESTGRLRDRQAAPINISSERRCRISSSSSRYDVPSAPSRWRNVRGLINSAWAISCAFGGCAGDASSRSRTWPDNPVRLRRSSKIATLFLRRGGVIGIGLGQRVVQQADGRINKFSGAPNSGSVSNAAM